MSSQETIFERMKILIREYNELAAQYVLNDPSQHFYNVIEKGVGENQDPNHLDCPYSGKVQELNEEIKQRDLKFKSLEKILSKQKEKNSTLNNDIDVLKDVTKRLNEQLNRYLLLVGPIGDTNSNDIEHNASSRHFINQGELYKFNALLTAYDEIIDERNEIIKEASQKVDSFVIQVNEITKENDSLHYMLDQLKDQENRSANTTLITKDAQLLLEEREVLLQERDVFHQKFEMEATQRAQEVGHLTQKLQASEDQLKNTKLDMLELEAKYKQLQCEHDKLQLHFENFIPRDDHVKAVNECKSLFKELKSNYNEESGILKNKVTIVKQEKQQLTEKVNDKAAQLQNLNAKVQGYKTSMRKTESKIERREHVIQNLQRSKKRMFLHLKSLALLCSKLMEERKVMLHEMDSERREKKRMLEDVRESNATIGSLNVKFKEEKMRLNNKLAESEGARKAANSAWKRCTEETKKLRNLIKIKDDTISTLLNNAKL